MRTLAIDLGTRRVGLAMSDEGGHFAMPFDVIEVTGADTAIEPIVALVRKEAVRRVIIGLPLNMEDGSIGHWAWIPEQRRSWARRAASRAWIPA